MEQEQDDFLFDVDTESIEKEWFDMPEFIQEEQAPYAYIIVKIDSQKNLEKFAKLMEQDISQKTKSIWYPKLIKNVIFNQRYVGTNE